MPFLFRRSRLIFISFFAFGLLNNILYVVILSAAVDLVGAQVPKATVLLADIVPSFLIKLTAPFFIQWVSYHHRILILVGLSSIGMLLIGFSSQERLTTKIAGICMASLSSGLGEFTFLQLTHFYDRGSSIAGFSSGTGSAGLLGSFVYMFLTSVLNVKTWLVLIIFALLPLAFLFVFYGVLPTMEVKVMDVESEAGDDQIQGYFAKKPLSRKVVNHFSGTVNKAASLFFPYMLPLGLVYICEYVINQGISPTLLFPLESVPSWLLSSYRDFYVVYGFLYQLGVFFSRSSVSLGIRIKNLYLLAILQAFNVIIVTFQSLYDSPFASLLTLSFLIFYEGLLGGFLYVNTFMSVSEQMPAHMREFSMGCVGISDTFGVMVAGCISWFIEPFLCQLQVKRGKDWCTIG